MKRGEESKNGDRPALYDISRFGRRYIGKEYTPINRDGTTHELQTSASCGHVPLVLPRFTENGPVQFSEMSDAFLDS
jgi:hypothetical protein